ncbi:cyclodeaminase/cyclohydrolase family protein [Alkalibacter rhizosphaerae]|uniref:Cyclodeaminase/cyclohydrolase family protein n=2 Tax=Alkalibacter rhizosphaerae TaxID=2815577 RepID=A0A975AHT8_9FIRM|nr:cyclodeaminase/cyclohydrolase family protein [Alkalibacter rhizosphaerae]QSX08363.1 cyclodeaminase/cyclohydrolase family protein [Alkalibacter rhizosphaerae]
MKMVEGSCTDFAVRLASKDAVPGGGGAAALVGAIGTALASMVVNLTLGKKKYAEYEEINKEIMAKAQKLQDDLLAMVDLDAENFLPLSKAYGLPKETEEQQKIKEETLEKCLIQACQVPVDIVKKSYEAILLHQELVDKGSKLAISDVGVGVQCLRAALISGWINVVININMIKSEDYVKQINEEVKPLVGKGTAIADEVYAQVEAMLSK